MKQHKRGKAHKVKIPAYSHIAVKKRELQLQKRPKASSIQSEINMFPYAQAPMQSVQMAPQLQQADPATRTNQIPTYEEFSRRVALQPQKPKPVPRKDENDDWDCLFGFPADMSKKDNSKQGARLMSGSMFTWKKIANTQLRTGEAVLEYPFTRKNPASKTLAINDFAEVKNLVQICLDSRNHACGDIADLIAQDLLLAVAESEIQTLPKLDPIHPYWRVPEDAVAMLEEKLFWATYEHAHRLAIESTVDIAVTWHLPAPSPDPEDENKMHIESHIVYMTTADLRIYNKVAACSYKPYPLTRDDDEPDMETGGFYAVVPQTLYSSLQEVLSRHEYKFFATVIVRPRQLPEEELAELEEYHATRIRESEELLAKRKAEEEKAARETELLEYQKRKANSYAAAVQRDKEQLWDLKLDWRVGDVAESERRWDEKWLKMTGGWYD